MSITSYKGSDASSNIRDNKYYERLHATVRYLNLKGLKTGSIGYLYASYLALLLLIALSNPLNLILCMMLLCLNYLSIMYNQGKMHRSFHLNGREFDLISDEDREESRLDYPHHLSGLDSHDKSSSNESLGNDIFLMSSYSILTITLTSLFVFLLPPTSHIVSFLMIPLTQLNGMMIPYLYRRRLLSQLDPDIESMTIPLRMNYSDSNDSYQYLKEYLQGAISLTDGRNGSGILGITNGIGCKLRGGKYFGDAGVNRILLENEKLGSYYSELCEECLGINPDASISEWNLPSGINTPINGEEIDDLLMQLRDNWNNYNDVGNSIFRYHFLENDYLKSRPVKGGFDGILIDESSINLNFPYPYLIPKNKYDIFQNALSESIHEINMGYMERVNPDNELLKKLPSIDRQKRLFITWNCMVNWDDYDALNRGTDGREKTIIGTYRGVDRYIGLYLAGFYLSGAGMYLLI